MKKYLISVSLFLIVLFLSFISYYVLGFYINFNKEVSSFTASDNEYIYVNNEKFTIKGVNLGSAIPEAFPNDYKVDKETYKRWFSDIQEMGANTIRIYTILNSEFYEAFYEYNKNNPNPLYLIHGVWINDYILNSKVDGYHTTFKDKFLYDIKVMIDIIHGRRYVPLNDDYASGLYTKNISKWVIGYILGVEWESVTVAYTDNTYSNQSYFGEYVSTKEKTSAFVSMLAEVADKSIKYETEKYNQQRLIAFSNWPITDPLEHSEEVTNFFEKCAKVDVENIVFNNNFIGGTFASYHVYPYYPDYLNYEGDKSNYIDSNGSVNTYYAYLKKLNEHHNIPVVISEFGVSTSRGIAQKDLNTNFNHGNMSEKNQGEALTSMYKSIIDSGSAGGIVFTWQDEWYKRAWNTMQNVDLNYTPYWNDVQNTAQHFGLLSFEPGKNKNISYVDGNIEEWTKEDIIVKNNNMTLSMKYDLKNIYLMADIKKYNKEKLYIPIDITQKSGSKTTNISSNTYDKDIDFLIEIDGKDNSRIYVQEYYDSLLAMFSENITGNNIYYNPPKPDSTKFNKINLILQTANPLITGDATALAEVYETGKLKHGISNPKSKSFDSLADFYIKENIIEIKIPWQILNFSNPSKMTVHDDYYKNYGIENIEINKMSIGIGYDNEHISLKNVPLEGWNKVEYHERLKQSYYILKEYWTGGNS